MKSGLDWYKREPHKYLGGVRAPNADNLDHYRDTMGGGVKIRTGEVIDLAEQRQMSDGDRHGSASKKWEFKQ